MNAPLKFWCLKWNIIFLEGADNYRLWWITLGIHCFFETMGILRGHFATLPHVIVVIPSLDTYWAPTMCQTLILSTGDTAVSQTDKIPACAELKMLMNLSANGSSQIFPVSFTLEYDTKLQIHWIAYRNNIVCLYPMNGSGSPYGFSTLVTKGRAN